MASYTGSTISGIDAAGIKGYGGLASGMDRDKLIEGMTVSTRTKIAKQQIAKQSYQWKQDALRSISSKLVEFSQKYMSYTGSANLSSPGFFASAVMTEAVGENSKHISVSGHSPTSNALSIARIKQLAQNAVANSAASVSEGKLSTGQLHILDSSGNLVSEPVSGLEGQNLTIQYGNKTFSVSLGSGVSSDGFTYDYSTDSSAKESLQRALSNVSIGNGRTLSDIIEVSTQNNNGRLGGINLISKDTGGNKIQITGGSQAALEALGVVGSGVDITNAADADKTITSTGLSGTAQNRQANALFTPKNFADRMGGKKITFSYNGTTKSIAFMSKSDIESLRGNSNTNALDRIRQDMQKKLDQAFGTGRITVGANSDELTFETTIPGSQAKDPSSVLTMISADAGVLGKNGAFKTNPGDSNRLNVHVSLVDSGLKGIGASLSGKPMDITYFAGSNKLQNLLDSWGGRVSPGDSIVQLKNTIAQTTGLSDKERSSITAVLDYFRGNGAATVADVKTELHQYITPRQLDLTVNGKEIKGLTYNSSLYEIMNAVNAADAGVNLSYMSNADKFVLTATQEGAAGKIEISGGDAEILFGRKNDPNGYQVADGKDAVIQVKYTNSGQEMEITRGSNTFQLDGLNVTLKGTFGYDSAGNIDPTAKEVTFSSKINPDTVTKAVADMVKDYNAIVEMVNKEARIKPNRNYQPLSEAQKGSLTQDQIEKYENKAKEGILFGDSDLRTLSDSLRFIFPVGSDDMNQLKSFGITTSSNISENGKLIFNETEFKAQMEKNPEDVKRLFTRPADLTNGDQGGLMARLNRVVDKYASTIGVTKGILIERAGSVYAPTSILTNALEKNIQGIDDRLRRLNEQLGAETDRYIRQFTSLETVISQMNSQSSWLSSTFGGM